MEDAETPSNHMGDADNMSSGWYLGADEMDY